MAQPRKKRERRLKLRHPLSHLKLRLRVRRGWLTHEWVDVRPLDFSLRGLSFRTDEVFEPGDRATLALQFMMEMGDLSLESVEVIVRHREKHCSCFNYGCEFNPARTRNWAHASQVLTSIEALLSRYGSLVSKLDQGPLSRSRVAAAQRS